MVRSGRLQQGRIVQLTKAVLRLYEIAGGAMPQMAKFLHPWLAAKTSDCKCHLLINFDDISIG
jgi:hypothetical protein